ncbi:MAG: 50S ribosomal protein L9 [Sulfuricurvum sp.]
MKVLLIKDVKSLGKVGEVKEVKDGYGKNFLIAKGFAKPATTEVLAQHAEDEKNAKIALAQEIADLKATAKKLEDLKVVIAKKAGENGALFGAITKDDVAKELLEKHGIEIDKKSITDKSAIKELGSHTLDLKLGHAIHAKLHIEVVAE